MNAEPLRILLVADYFGRDVATGAKRANAFAKYWGRQPGVSVTALTSYKQEVRMGPEGSVELGEGVREIRVRWPDIVGLQLLWKKTGPAKPTEATRKEPGSGPAPKRRAFWDAWKVPFRFVSDFLVTPDRHALWATSALARGSFTGKPDIVVATAPSFVNLLVARMLGARYGVPYVVDLRDPWHSNPFHATRTGVLRRWEERLERFAMRRAARVWLTTWEMKDQYAVRTDLTDPDRLTVISNGYDEEEWRGIERKRTTPGDAIQILHAGSLYGVRSPIPFLEDLGRVLRGGEVALRNKVRVRFLGACDPRFKGRIDELTEQFDLADIVNWESQVGFHEALESQMNTDLLLLVGHRSDRPVTQIPLKLYEALRARRPQLAYFQRDSAVAQFARRHPDFGIHVADLDSPATRWRALASVLRSLDERDLTVESPEIVQYERAAQAENALTLLRAIVRESRQPA